MKFRKRELDQFWYWINERHRIFLAKEGGDPWPWTKDSILQQYRFTNVFRQLDRVTWEFNAIVPNLEQTDWTQVVYHWMAARLFNWPETYEYLVARNMVGAHLRVPASKIQAALEGKPGKIFTGAYIITNGGRSEPKTQICAEAMVFWREGIAELAADMAKHRSVEQTTQDLKNLPMMGWFTAYEVACDLMFVRGGPLYRAKDRKTWANPGPGARRGLSRLTVGKLGGRLPTKQCLQGMRELLDMAPDRLEQHVLSAKLPFEMREVEHSLCEFDKYQRAKRGEGRPRSVYRRSR